MSHKPFTSNREPEIRCELKFGKSEEPEFMGTFVRDDEELKDSGKIEVQSASVWQGRLQDEDFFEFEMVRDDEFIQLKSLEIKVFENEESLGLVQLDVSPLLFKKTLKLCNGWFPIYSVEKGITGELKVEIQMEYMADLSSESYT